MRWLANKLIQDSLLELEDGSFVYYEYDFTGPGYVLGDRDKSRLLGRLASAGWALIIYFAFPEVFLREQLTLMYGHESLIEILLALFLLAVFLLFFGVFLWTANRLLKSLERRDPALWEQDLAMLFPNLPPDERKSGTMLLVLGGNSCPHHYRHRLGCGTSLFDALAVSL